MLEEINGKGAVCGVIAWFIFLAWLAHDSSCARFNSCGLGDIFLISILAVGMIIPATIVAVVASIFLGKK